MRRDPGHQALLEKLLAGAESEPAQPANRAYFQRLRLKVRPAKPSAGATPSG